MNMTEIPVSSASTINSQENVNNSEESDKSGIIFKINK